MCSTKKGDRGERCMPVKKFPHGKSVKSNVHPQSFQTMIWKTNPMAWEFSLGYEKPKNATLVILGSSIGLVSRDRSDTSDFFLRTKLSLHHMNELGLQT